MQQLGQFLGRYGPLRVILGVVTLGLVLLAPLAGGPTQKHGWQMFPTLIAPAVVPLVFFGYLLIMLMSRVFMSDAGPGERARLRMVIRTDAILLAILVLAWGPFFYRLLAG